MDRSPMVTMAGTVTEARDLPLVSRVEQELAQLADESRELREQAKAVARLASTLKPLASAKLHADLSRLSRHLDKIETKVLARSETAERGRGVIGLMRAGIEDRKREIREGLARDLKSQCEARGLTFRVIQRDEPVEIRLPPFAVTIDRERGSAVVKFARLPVKTCAARAQDIIEAREEALGELNGPFDGPEFLEACRRAWFAARAAAGEGGQERVEIVNFLPYLALEFQRPAFRVEPTRQNYRSYSRARFAWDVLRLRRAGGLAHGGWRLNLGVASGASASRKSRVIWFEDENGDGEYKLTVFFTRVEAPE